MSTLDFLSDFVSREQLAVALKCSSRTLARYEQQPDGLPSLLIAGRKYYRTQTVHEWLGRRMTRPNPRRR